MLSFLEPSQLCLELAARLKSRRLQLTWSQAELAARAGVAYSTLKLFERTGQISLERLVLIAAALGALDGFNGLFTLPKAASLEELEARVVTRKRGRRRTP
jgi:transcriptional regulator with XRE-family HTH domain